ncbi:MAG: hypothetical protein ACREJC_05665, partial [Tepidisphaeraceae bacterium]
WDDAAGDGRLTTAWSQLSKMSSRSYKGDDNFVGSAGHNAAETRGNYAPFMRCPEAQLVLPHICSYVVQHAACPIPYNDKQVNGGNIQDKPANLRDLLPFTVLAHDTAVVPGMNNDVGYVTSGDVDAQRISFQAARNNSWPNRFYSPRDPFARIGTGLFSNNKPVAMGSGWQNIDPPPLDADGFNTYFYQGNLRFRHGKGTLVNCGFADGRVESLQQKECLRKMFMIKWPTGLGLAKGTGPGW